MIHGKIAAKACDIRPKDARDERPLNLAGRFLCPTDGKGLIAKFWAKSTLLVKGRTMSLFAAPSSTPRSAGRQQAGSWKGCWKLACTLAFIFT